MKQSLLFMENVEGQLKFVIIMQFFNVLFKIGYATGQYFIEDSERVLNREDLTTLLHRWNQVDFAYLYPTLCDVLVSKLFKEVLFVPVLRSKQAILFYQIMENCKETEGAFSWADQVRTGAFAWGKG